MGNPLGRDVEVGERVVISIRKSGSVLLVAQRIFICLSGGGMFKNSLDHTIRGEWMASGEVGEIESGDISGEETDRLPPEEEVAFI